MEYPESEFLIHRLGGARTLSSDVRVDYLFIQSESPDTQTVAPRVYFLTIIP